MKSLAGFKLFLGLSSTLLIWTACERPLRVATTRWHGDGPLPAVPLEPKDQSAGMRSGSEILQFQTQKIENVPIEGAYFKSIEKNGKPTLIAYRWYSESGSRLRKKIANLKKQMPAVNQKFQAHVQSLDPKRIISGPDLVVTATDPMHFEWRMVIEEKDGTLRGLSLREDLRHFSVRPLGSGFVDVSASLYPKGPLRSDISDVWLRQLSSLQGLESDRVLIRTESNLQAVAEKNQHRYTSGDPRFSQVQAYFFATEALKWFAQKWSFQLPFRLEIETQKGFPEKTNTAFYFQHKVRLGEGDDAVYSRIPLDPSIVIHETIHAVVEAVAGLPYEGEGGSLNEALADYFTATQLDNPRMGEVSYRKDLFKRNLQNDGKADQKNGGLYHDSLLVSGLLWQIRTDVGVDVANRLAWKILTRLTPDSNFKSFTDEIIRAIADEPPDFQAMIRALLKNRGWVQPD